MRNIFIVNTPFQLFVVRCIIRQYFNTQENLVISTIKNKTSEDIITVSHDLSGIIKARRLFRDIEKRVKDESFFIPHVGNLFSSYVFHLSLRYDRPISVYYEGIALFYNPIVEKPREAQRRKLASVLLGIEYIHYDQLYPDVLLKKARACYSPISSPLLSKYNDTIIVDFEKRKVDSQSNNILLLTYRIATEEDVERCLAAVTRLTGGDGQIVYVKPHYELPEGEVLLFMKRMEVLENVQVVLLDKTKPIEELFEQISFKYVVSQHFSSALVNMKYIIGEDFRCLVINKESIPNKIVDALGITIE